MMKSIQIIALLCFAISNPLVAQEPDARYANDKKTVPFGVIEEITSDELSEQRVLNIYNYIIVSPSLWWDKQRMVDGAATFFKSNPHLNKNIFLSLGKEHPVMHEVADKLVDAIRK